MSSKVETPYTGLGTMSEKARRLFAAHDREVSEFQHQRRITMQGPLAG